MSNPGFFNFSFFFSETAIPDTAVSETDTISEYISFRLYEFLSPLIVDQMIYFFKKLFLKSLHRTSFESECICQNETSGFQNQTEQMRRWTEEKLAPVFLDFRIMQHETYTLTRTKKSMKSHWES